ncbi:MAG TPA: transporter [Firmicutes bacterium]|nr:transporter [Bacillota bacterium]
MNESAVFVQVLVLFILILVGYLIRKKDLIDEIFTSKLTNLILTIFLPCMIIDAMQIQYEPSMLGKIGSLILISLIMYTITIVVSYAYQLGTKKKVDSEVFQYAILFSNVGFMGYPVVEAVLGKDAIFYTAIFNLPFNLFVSTIGVYLFTKGNKHYQFSFKELLNPVIYSVILGFTFFLCNIQLPDVINSPLSLLGNMTTPLSMIVIGSMLCASNIGDAFKNKQMYVVSIIRLIVLPVLVFYLLKGQVSDPLLFGIPIIISAMPAASNTAIYANKYEANGALASQVVFITTLFSIVTIPLMASLLLG